MKRRCLKCPTSALPDHDLCLLCWQYELAAKARARIKRSRKKRKPARRYGVSVTAETYQRIQAAAKARGWSVRQLVEEATRGV